MLPMVSSVFLARWQFAIAASVHFLFVPLTLGLTWILFTMECAYVLTGKEVYKDMTQYWGKLLGINFALGVLTGLTMAFSFGTNWAYYSQYVGDIFGTPLAIEGFLAFMLESIFFGIFFFGWDKLSKKQHLMATFCLALGSSLSAMLILVANGFMQHPVGAQFDYATMRMETTSLISLFMNPMAQAGFVHTVFGGYLTASVFVLGISAFYLLKRRDIEFAKRSFAVAAGFGLVVSIMVTFAGDQNGVAVAQEQPAKLAAIEADFNTEASPAFNVIAIPSQEQGRNLFAIEIPHVLGLIVNHRYNSSVAGINNIVQDNIQHIQEGKIAYGLLQQIRNGNATPKVIDQFKQYQDNLGYGMMLERYTPNVVDATPDQIKAAAEETIPTVWSTFYAFRIMVGFGIIMILVFLLAFIKVLRNNAWNKAWLLRAALYSIPLPWVCVLCGWFVTEHGRQPWTVFGILPTTLSSSFLTTADMWLSFAIFCVLFAVLTAVEFWLMFKFARLGPSTLHLGKYHFESDNLNQRKIIGEK